MPTVIPSRSESSASRIRLRRIRTRLKSIASSPLRGLSANMYRFVKTVAVCSIPIAASLFAHEMKQPVNSNAYSHGTITCLQGNDGPGLRLQLTQKKTCEGRLSYPRLEVDIREQPVPVRKRIAI